MKSIVQFALTVLLALALGACDITVGGDTGTDSNDGNGGDSTAGDVQLNGIMTIGPIESLVRELPTSPDAYTLQCNTYASPVAFGTSGFSTVGDYGLSLSGAADVPFGCYLYESSTGYLASVVSFLLPTSGSFGVTQTTSATLSVGTYTLNIAFDPDNGVAIATLPTGYEPPTAGGEFDLTELTGSWNMACSSENTSEEYALCQGFLDETDHLFIDVVSASYMGEDAYLMAVWQDSTVYADMGSTEGMTDFPSEVTDLVSLLGDDPTQPFVGFSSESFFDGSQYSVAASDMPDGLFALMGSDTETNFADFLENGKDPETTCAATAAELDLATMGDRYCFLEWLDYLAEEQQYYLYGVPELEQETWNDYAEQMGSEITFRENFGSVRISPRMTLMETVLVGDSAVASESEYGYYFQDTTMCDYSHQLSVSFTQGSGDTTTGRFSVSEVNTCEGEYLQGTFLVDWTRP